MKVETITEGGVDYEVRTGAYGSRSWYVNGQRHRLDGPAIEWADGTRSWWVNGQLHRLDGPAVEWASGGRQWWVNGQRVDCQSDDDPAFKRAVLKYLQEQTR